MSLLSVPFSLRGKPITIRPGDHSFISSSIALKRSVFLDEIIAFNGCVVFVMLLPIAKPIFVSPKSNERILLLLLEFVIGFMLILFYMYTINKKNNSSFNVSNN